MAQNVAEIRALTGWLLDEGCPSVGLLSFSFGGWVAGLTACGDARIAAVVLTMPAVAFRMFSSPPIVWRRVREALQALRACVKSGCVDSFLPTRGVWKGHHIPVT
jgi:alpha/beta superfamily hydrolase